MFPSVFFNLLRQFPAVGNDRGSMPQPNQFTVQAENDGFNAALVEFRDDLYNVHGGEVSRLVVGTE